MLLTQRFQRGSNSLVPMSVRLLKSKFSSTNGWDKNAALEFSEMPAQIDLPGFQRRVLERLADGLEKFRSAHIHGIDIGVADGLKIVFPGPVGRQGFQLRAIHFVISLVGIAAIHARHGRFRQPGFELHDGLGFAGGPGCVISRELQYFRDVHFILLPQLLGFVIGPRVVIAFGQAQAVLVGSANHLRTVFCILRGAKLEHGAHTHRLQPRNFRL